MEERSIFKSKTFWAAIVQFLVAVAAYFSGSIDLKILIGDFVAMVMVVFYRDSIGVNLRNILNGFFSKVTFLKDGVFWTVIAGVLGSIGAWLGGAIDLQTAILTIVSALVMFFLRSAQVPEWDK